VLEWRSDLGEPSMRLDELPRSGNIQDRRGVSFGRTGGIGIGTLIVLTIVGWALGINPLCAALNS